MSLIKRIGSIILEIPAQINNNPTKNLNSKIIYLFKIVPLYYQPFYSLEITYLTIMVADRYHK